MLTIPGKRILVTPHNENSAIILAKPIPSKYRVVYIGNDVTECQTGDLVYLAKYAGQDIEHDNQKFLVYHESDIIAVTSP